jgi:hypothetical protein
MYTPGTAVVGLGVGRGGLDGGEPCESKGDQERADYFHCESPTFTTPSGLNTRSPRFSSAILHGPGPAFSSRADLADRAIFLTLAPIAAQRRRSEAEPGREFELARPCILGALLDAATHGLRTLPCVRLADFAIWATACETAF